MADTTPTAEQVEAANNAQAAHWEGDFKEEDLLVPYKREDAAAADTPAEQEALPDEEEVSAEEPVVEVTDEYEVPVTLPDPGEYRMPDYSFDVTLKDGKTVTIKTPEDADKLSEDPDNFETPKQLLDFIKKTTQMQNKLDKDFAKWEDQKQAFDKQNEAQSARNAEITAVQNEVEYLVSKGKLPAVSSELQNANWSDPKVAAQPGVKEQVALLTYMAKENAIRDKAGIKPFGPVDALTAMQNDASEKAKVAANKEAGEQRKAASSRVAGVAPSQTGTYVPKGIAVGRAGIFNRGAAVWDN